MTVKTQWKKKNILSFKNAASESFKEHGTYNPGPRILNPKPL